MSMSLALVSFNKDDNNNLLADYEEFEGYEVIVTDFINEMITNVYIKDFKASEDGEDVILREIDHEQINDLSTNLKLKFKELCTELNDTSGKSKKTELLNKIEDIYLLTDLFREFYRIALETPKKNMKILVG